MLRKVGMLALCLALTLLAAGAVQARPLAGSPRAAESEGVMARIWDWVASLFQQGGGPEGIKSFWEKDSSHIDPNGGPH